MVKAALAVDVIDMTRFVLTPILKLFSDVNRQEGTSLNFVLHHVVIKKQLGSDKD